MKKAYITRKIPSVAKEILQHHFLVEENLEGPLSQKQLIHVVQNYEAVLSTLADRFDDEVLRKASSVKAISNYAVGLDNIDTKVASSLGVTIYHLPDIVTSSTADLAMALLLSYEREICQASRYVQSGQWKRWEPLHFLGHEMQEKKMGILGFGRIGQALAKRALSFGMEVNYASRSEKALPAELNGKVARVPLDQLFSQSDYLCLLVPLTDDTRAMIDLQVFQNMKRNALLINLARGAVVKTDDLVFALTHHLIRGALLDVTDPEPLPLEHPLLKLNNCLIVPHIGTATEECRYQMAKKAALQLVDHFAQDRRVK